MAPVRDGRAPRHRSHATLLINDHRIALHADVNLKVVLAAILKAVLSGGGFVSVAGPRGQSYDILITPITQVLMRHDSISDDDDERDEPWTTTMDLEY